MVGCLLAGFYLLRMHDMATATYVAATMNATVALTGLGLAARARYTATNSESLQGDALRARGTWAVYVAIAISGMRALGAEVIWTRLLSLLLGATVYTFAIILAVFLTGLAIGSAIGALLSRASAQPRLALASVVQGGQDPGRLLGGIYAAHTVGAIVGAIGFSLGAVPALGTQQSQRTLIVLSCVTALLMFTIAGRR